MMKHSRFPTNGDPERMRKKGRWFGIRGMEKTAKDFFDAADTIERLQGELAAQAKTVERLENMLFRAGSMDEPPCFLCGYNGEGYFQPDKHPCAAKHHAAIDAARKGS